MSKKNILDGLEGPSSFIATEEDLLAIGASIPNPQESITNKSNIEKYLDIECNDGSPNSTIVYNKKKEVITPPKNENIDEARNNDFEYMRTNLYSVIETSHNALSQLAQIAAQSQHPRAFEVLSLLVKTIADANRDLMKIHEEKNSIEIKNNKSGKAGVTNNNLFIGTTAQLDEIMKQLKVSKKIDD